MQLVVVGDKHLALKPSSINTEQNWMHVTGLQIQYQHCDTNDMVEPSAQHQIACYAEVLSSDIS